MNRLFVSATGIVFSCSALVAAFTNLGGDQDLRNAVGKVALQIATRVYR